MNKRFFSILICMVIAVAGIALLLPAETKAEVAKEPYIVSAGDTGESVLQAWNSGAYSYVKLSTGLSLTLNGETIAVDLAGNDLVASGCGKVQAFDSANDTFDHTVCGVVTCNGSVVCESETVSPEGIRYVALNLQT